MFHIRWIIVSCSILGLIGTLALAQNKTEDPFLWLEEVTGKKPLEWAKKQNKITVEKIESITGFHQDYERTLKILDSKDRIPFPDKHNEYIYNFWRDAEHPKGIYRRTMLNEYIKKKPAWETVLDIDKLAKAEGENWVYKGMQLLYPKYKRGLLSLSRGGTDARVVREFDLKKKSFVKNGFYLPEAKSDISWIDKNTLFVGTDFGKGSLTQSGYPRIVKLWKRNMPLTTAKTVFEVDSSSISTQGERFFSKDGHLDIITDGKTFFSNDVFVLKEGKLQKLDIPSDAYIFGYFKKQLLLRLRSSWSPADQTFPTGSLIIGSVEGILAGNLKFDLLIKPTDRLSVENVATTKNTILVTVLDNVVGKLYQYTQSKDGRWQQKQVKLGDNGSISIISTEEKSDAYFVSYESFLTPDSLFYVSSKPNKIKSEPAFFDTSPYQVKQFEATSKDKTKIPYFVVMQKDIKLNGNNPTLLYGYGGFQISLAPRYLGTLGPWLEKGAVFVQANIRGGGEFGPKWHQAALKKNRHKAFEDFIAVAEDLIRRKITSPKKLAIEGGSNGGLLVGAVMTMRPDLFNAVSCAVPLLDMKRYNKLLAGVSWEAEYGNPDDPDMWAYIKTYSPYHNIKKDIKHPAILLLSSTRDDRVHPGHARKMTALMKKQGHKDVYYYENIEGGHAAAANNQQRAYMKTLSSTFLYDQLSK